MEVAINQQKIIHFSREMGMLITTWEQTFSYLKETQHLLTRQSLLNKESYIKLKLKGHK
jgi:hypothetical protein